MALTYSAPLKIHHHGKYLYFTEGETETLHVRVLQNVCIESVIP